MIKRFVPKKVSCCLKAIGKTKNQHRSWNEQYESFLQQVAPQMCRDHPKRPMLSENRRQLKCFPSCCPKSDMIIHVKCVGLDVPPSKSYVLYDWKLLLLPKSTIFFKLHVFYGQSDVASRIAWISPAVCSQHGYPHTVCSFCLRLNRSQKFRAVCPFCSDRFRFRSDSTKLLEPFGM